MAGAWRSADGKSAMGRGAMSCLRGLVAGAHAPVRLAQRAHHRGAERRPQQPQALAEPQHAELTPWAINRGGACDVVRTAEAAAQARARAPSPKTGACSAV